MMSRFTPRRSRFSCSPKAGGHDRRRSYNSAVSKAACSWVTCSSPGFALVLVLYLLTGPAVWAQPWWERETAMSEGGRLRLDDKPWWPRAAALEPGKHFVMTSEYPGGGLMMVRRDANGDIVWILDDDGDMDPDDPRPDRDSDCYVADYGGDGTVDRLLDYIDNDGDGKADEMGIRYFRESELKFNWLSFDI